MDRDVPRRASRMPSATRASICARTFAGSALLVTLGSAEHEVRRDERLEAELAKARKVITIQGNVSALFWSRCSVEPDLGSAFEPRDVERLALVDEFVEFLGADLLVVLHGYITLQARAAATSSHVDATSLSGVSSGAARYGTRRPLPAPGERVRPPRGVLVGLRSGRAGLRLGCARAASGCAGPSPVALGPSRVALGPGRVAFGLRSGCGVRRTTSPSGSQRRSKEANMRTRWTSLSVLAASVAAVLAGGSPAQAADTNVALNALAHRHGGDRAPRAAVHARLGAGERGGRPRVQHLHRQVVRPQRPAALTIQLPARCARATTSPRSS